jgi:hypothetical protein
MYLHIIIYIYYDIPGRKSTSKLISVFSWYAMTYLHFYKMIYDK